VLIRPLARQRLHECRFPVVNVTNEADVYLWLSLFVRHFFPRNSNWSIFALND
jgi:hypothetical protein